MICDCQFPIADCYADWIASSGYKDGAYPLEHFIEVSKQLFTMESYFFQGWHMAAHRFERQLNPQSEIANPKF